MAEVCAVRVLNSHVAASYPRCWHLRMTTRTRSENPVVEWRRVASGTRNQPTRRRLRCIVCASLTSASGKRIAASAMSATEALKTQDWKITDQIAELEKRQDRGATSRRRSTACRPPQSCRYSSPAIWPAIFQSFVFDRPSGASTDRPTHRSGWSVGFCAADDE